MAKMRDYIFWATVTNVHDGDTIYLDIDQGFGTHQTELHCRIYGINSPELSTTEGKIAQQYAESLIPVGSTVQVTSVSWDKYGQRFDGYLTLPDGRDFGTEMLKAEQAVAYTA